VVRFTSCNHQIAVGLRGDFRVCSKSIGCVFPAGAGSQIVAKFLSEILNFFDVPRGLVLEKVPFNFIQSYGRYGREDLIYLITGPTLE